MHVVNLKDDGVVDGAQRGTVDSDADVCDGHVGLADDATALHPYGDYATFSGNAYVSVLFTLKDDGVVNDTCRGTVESDAEVCDGLVVSAGDATDFPPYSDSDSFGVIANVCVLFNLREDGVVDGARRGTVDSDADVFDGHVCSTDDATDLHPSGDHEKFCGIAYVCILFNLKDDGAVDGARRGTVDSGYADVRGGHVRSTDDATALHPYGDCAIFN